MKRTLIAWFIGASACVAQITVSETVEQGQPSYRIATPTATWVYHREGAGFSGLFDPAGNDWLSYRPEGGAAGNFRGIPNAVFRRQQAGNNFFHAGHAGPKGSKTTIVAQMSERVLLRSESTDGRWTCEWEILPDRARFRLARIPADDPGYWFLYEGTPGGRFDPKDLVVRPGGIVTPLSESWEMSMKAVPWVAFVSPTKGRALLLVAHEGSDTPVSYRPMQDAMTVLGFGRTLKNLDGMLKAPLTITVALIAETAPKEIETKAARIAAGAPPR